MNKKHFSNTAILLLIILPLFLKSQSIPTYQERIGLLQKAIDQKLTDRDAGLYFETAEHNRDENKHSWLWPLCALVQAANEQEAVQPGKPAMQHVEKAIVRYYHDTLNVPAYQDYVLKERSSSRFYDDNEWIAIADLDAYNRTHRQGYLKDAEMIYRFIESGIDTVAGGGVYWKEGDHTTKNTCSNGPAILVALQLYKINRRAAYLRQAMALYNWTNHYLQAPDGLYYDHVKIPSLQIGKALYTYNTGTMLQANVLLYEITKDRRYLTEAQRIATAGRARFFVNGRLPGGEYWFNAVMFRGYEALYKADANRDWISFFATDADHIWISERDADNLVGSKPNKRLIDQAALIEIYARLQNLKEKL